MASYTYIILDLFTIAPVLFLSFDKWVQFYKKWIPALLAILPVGIGFVLWDLWFVDLKVWHFNPEYLIGVGYKGLPLEEYLFFLVVPWVCLFIYESISYHLPVLLKFKKVQLLYYIFLLAAVLMLVQFEGYYTVVNASVLIFTSLLLLFFCSTTEKVFFMWMYLIHILPFAAVNGVLTASPVVVYNDLENMGIRVGTIPLDDFFYSFNLLGLVFVLYRTVLRLPFVSRSL